MRGARDAAVRPNLGLYFLRLSATGAFSMAQGADGANRFRGGLP